MSARTQLLREDDANWPPPDRVGRQELEVILDDQHISFTTTKLGSLTQVTQSKDPDGLRVFYYLVQARLCGLGRRGLQAFQVPSGGPASAALPACRADQMLQVPWSGLACATLGRSAHQRLPRHALPVDAGPWAGPDI